ncbi:MAG: transcriptional regulator, TetR family [Nonomuraea muscovyensis]|nr:transcriptional regulator, TetR family [Nonomuraea muscovyensis]
MKRLLSVRVTVPAKGANHSNGTATHTGAATLRSRRQVGGGAVLRVGEGRPARPGGGGAVARVFARHGYASGTTDRIAEEAGLSIGSLYRYFPNKDAILVALARARLEQTAETVQAVLAEPRPLSQWLPAATIESLVHRFVGDIPNLDEAAPDEEIHHDRDPLFEMTRSPRGRDPAQQP